MLFKSFELYLAFRYLRSKKSEGFISLSTWFSFVGIALGVATLIIVMSVMNGFREELVNRILGINGHLVVYANNGKPIENYNDISKKVSDNNNVFSVIPQIDGQGLARSKDYVSGVMIKGIRWTDLPAKKLLWDNLNKITKENFKTKNEIIIGSRLAKRLNVMIGDKITIVSANGIKTALGVIPQKQIFKIGGLFNVGMYEYDNNFIFMPWKSAQNFFQLGDVANNIEIFLKDYKSSDTSYLNLKKVLNGRFEIVDWKKQNNTFINALNVEKNVMFLILTLIILVAAFNIISSMIMLVNAKSGDIALLRTIGSSKKAIVKIFLLVGTSIGLLGTVFGAIIGVFLSINIEYLRKFLSIILNQELFSPEIYFLTDLPSKIDFTEVFYIIFTSISLSVLASVFPSWKAAKILPAEVLRYE